MASPSTPNVFDPIRIAAHRSRAARRWPKYDFLKRRLSSDLIERLEDTPRHFDCALDLGCHGGTLAALFRAHGQVGSVMASDPSPAMAQLAARTGGLETVVSSLERVPGEVGSFDLVASVGSLHWVNDLPGVLVQVRRALKPDGLFLAALFGAGTLAELRTSLTEAETTLLGGVSPRISPLPGLQDAAALMQRTGFALPVVDLDRITVRYDTVFHLMADLRGMGEQAAFPSSRTRPLKRNVLAAMAEIYRERFADPDGRIRASFEVVWLSGWAPAPSQPKPLRPGSAKASLAAAVGATEQSAGEKAGQKKP